jgi:hypothetical protein
MPAMRRPAFAAALSLVLLLMVAPARAQVDEAQATAFIDAQLAALRAAGATSATRGAVTVDAATRSVTVADIALGYEGAAALTARIGRLDITGLDVAGGRARFTRATAEGLVVTTKTTETRTARLTAADVDMPAVAADAAPGTWLIGLLSTARAERIETADLRLSITIGSERLSYTQPTITATGFADGVARRLEASAAAFGLETGGFSPFAIESGRQLYENADVALYASLFGVAVRPPGATLTPLYTSGRIDGVKAQGPDGFSLETGPVTSGAMRMRTPTVSLQQLMAASAKVDAAGDDVPPDVNKEMAAALRDWIDIYRIDTMKMVDLKAKSGGVDIRLADMTATNVTDVTFETMVASGLAFAADVATGRIGTMEMRDLDFRAFMKATVDWMATGNTQDFDTELFKGNLPRLGLFELRDVTLDIPQLASGGFGKFSFAMGHWRGFSLDKFSVALNALDLPAEFAILALQEPDLTALGFERIKLDLASAFALDLDKGTGMIGPLSFGIADAISVTGQMGLTGLTGETVVVAGATGDPSLVAADIGFGSLDLSIQDRGLIERWVQQIVRDEKKRPDAARRDIVKALTDAMGQIKNEALRNRLRTAIQRFAAQGGRTLTLSMKPREATLEDFQTLLNEQTPAAYRKFEINMETK